MNGRLEAKRPYDAMCIFTHSTAKTESRATKICITVNVIVLDGIFFAHHIFVCIFKEILLKNQTGAFEMP